MVITLGCNYIINWRYRAQAASLRSGDIQIGTLLSLFAAWLSWGNNAGLRLTWVQPRGAITHNNGWPGLWMGPRLTHSICYQLPLDPFQRKHLGEAHILMATEHTVWIGWKSNTANECPSSDHHLAPPLINVSLSSIQILRSGFQLSFIIVFDNITWHQSISILSIHDGQGYLNPYYPVHFYLKNISRQMFTPIDQWLCKYENMYDDW